MAARDDSTKKQAYAVPELAENNDVSVAFLRNEIAAGRLRAYRIGRRQVRVLAEDWRTYREQHWRLVEPKLV